MRSFELSVCREGDLGGSPPMAAPTPAPAPAPWYTGKADERTVGHWQNNFPQHVNDPAALAVAVTSSWQEAQKLIGAPAHEIVRLPTKADAPEWAAVHRRLGRPDDAAEYVLKNKDGADFDATFADQVRKTSHALNLSKDAAQKLAIEMDTFSAAQKASEKAAYDTAITAEREKLSASWGAHTETNKEVARTGLQNLFPNLSGDQIREAVNALEKSVGYYNLMESLHRVGVRTQEGRVITGAKSGGDGNGTTPLTRGQAQARKAELYGDNDFVTRFNKGDAGAIREMDAIDRILVNTAAAA